ncbi:hypothetical protein BL253_36910 [Pseudofrankia asymbiotica]|uniref:Luciferase-like domain-containing protein n=1 Tax=Pseudofrankia asymbiotica TaxID=1834516 RepID=A0A1V2HZN3_9ACTN|nr:hypothetical protein BL253_36910 [Pseudofrankia asymbiotica]
MANPDTGEVDTARVVEAALRAEAAGFDGVHVGDHLLHPHPMLESVVTLSAVAARTTTISLGPCVLLMGLRSPAALAKQLGTLAAFAPGRLRVGVGVGGEYPAEFEVAGVPLSERGRRMELALSQVQALLRSGSGRADATIAPGAPDVPFLLAGWKEPSLRRAATLGDGWIGYLLTPDGFARRRAFLLDHREELGRAELPFSTGMLVPVHVDLSGRAQANAAAAWAKITQSEAGFPDRLFVAGRPHDVVEQLRSYWEAGCDEFVLGPADQGGGYLDQVDILAREVLPRVKAFA